VVVLLRLACLGVTNALAMPRLPPMSNRTKDAEILAPQRPPQGERVRFIPADRAFLSALLHRLPRDAPRQIRLLLMRSEAKIPS
jgi:putative transposase